MTKKELLEVIEQLRKEIHLLREENRLLREENAELKRRLALNSNNSSKPPSSDGLAKKPRNTSLRESSGKPSGGQKGHLGSTLKQVEKPDDTVFYDIQACSMCQASLISQPVKKVIKRQVFDIPKPQIFITEYQAAVKECPRCSERVMALFPANVTAPVQFGSTIEAYVTYLNNQHLVPEYRVQEIMKDCFDVSISTATIANISKVLATKLESFEQELLQYTKEAPVKNADETGMRIAGKTHWLHTISTPNTTLYRVSDKRKDLIDDLRGTIVHDHWKSYYQLPDIKHALCNAHHLRELKALIEIEKEPWAQHMFDLLTLANKMRYKCNGSPPAECIDIIREAYNGIITQGIIFHEAQLPLAKKARGKQPHRTGHNLLLRLRDYADDVLRFLYDSAVPFTNNLAEQDLRMMKVKQKISGGFRTFDGAVVFARIRSLLSTARKLGLNMLDALADALCGNTPRPSAC